jgi:CRISPR-associated protein (TIGR02584 family)
MKRILLAICGLSPQVVTETLYALHQQGRMPDAIRIITTRSGKEAVYANLLNGPDGRYHRFLRDFGIDPSAIDFGPRHVIAVMDPNGVEVDDITDEEENETFLAACMEAAFELTGDRDAQVLFSIAGGRKTMGACLALAAQCYGRPVDRIFHVLVSPEFESCRDFYYPPPVSVPVTLRDRQGQPYTKETRYARVTLVPMPFFPIRERLSDRLLREPESPAALMVSLVREKRHELVIDLVARKMAWKGREVDMMPARLALYAFFALRKKEQACGRGSCRGCDGCFLTVSEILAREEEIAALYRRIAPNRELAEMSDSGVTSLSKENFAMYRAKVHKDLERGYGPHELRHLEIASRGRRPGVQYGIVLDRDRIRVIV